LAKQYRLQMVLKMGRVALAKAAAKGKRAKPDDRIVARSGNEATPRALLY
jgi:hypothetical protein